MPYNIDISTLTTEQVNQAADLLQQLAALDGASAAVQSSLADFQMDVNAQLAAIQDKRNEITMALRALRTADVMDSSTNIKVR